MNTTHTIQNKISKASEEFEECIIV